MIDELTRKGLLDYIKPRFKLRWDGAHGISHWRRVESNGLLLCEKTKANPRVIALLSLLHDACRDNEYEDPDHGKRGADLAANLHGKLFDATSEELVLLTEACERHSLGLTKADVTIQTCWDADRLDLGRVGIKPNQKYLCTAAAKGSEVIQAAFLLSKAADYA